MKMEANISISRVIALGGVLIAHNPIALRTAKTPQSFGRSEFNWVYYACIIICQNQKKSKDTVFIVCSYVHA